MHCCRRSRHHIHPRLTGGTSGLDVYEIAIFKRFPAIEFNIEGRIPNSWKSFEKSGYAAILVPDDPALSLDHGWNLRRANGLVPSFRNPAGFGVSLLWMQMRPAAAGKE
jgi:hypothetical protein